MRNNKTFFRYQSLAVEAGVPSQPNFEGEFLYVRTLVGSIEMSLTGDGDWFPLFQGMKLRFKAHDRFKKIFLRSTAGGSVNFYYGMGDITIASESSEGDSPQMIVGGSSDPNADGITPDDVNSAAVYYATLGAAPETIQLWLWNPIGFRWAAAIS